jgi:hypothetical protein
MLRIKSPSHLLILVVACSSFTGCNPRELPGFKQIAKREEARITRETDEAIKKSPALQELEHLCTREIPRPEGFVPVNKSRDFHEEKFLSYGYHSSSDYGSVKRFYIEYLPKHGWLLTKQKDGGWGPSNMEFRRESHIVTIYDMGAGEGESYGIVCAKS